MTNEEYMRRALNLADMGYGKANPNPVVGAVIVKNGKIIGEGYHEGYGMPHAEANAIASCTESTVGASMYVTLEPCCHYGKTPPCTEAIIKSGINKVFVGALDQNPLVSGKGIEVLRKNGVQVQLEILKKECEKKNEVFFHYVKTGTPFMVMKYAMTLDGKIATKTGNSKWITGDLARQKVHEDRNKYAGIMVGVGTIIADNPKLTCRVDKGRNPVRIICDTNLKTPLNSNVVTDKEARTLIATGCAESVKHLPYTKAGCEIIVMPLSKGRIDLKALVKRLGEMGIDSILLEGGSALNWSALEAGIVCKLQVYLSTKMFGGEFSKGPIGGLGVENPKDAFNLKEYSVIKIGDDFLIEGDVIQNVYGNY